MTKSKASHTTKPTMFSGKLKGMLTSWTWCAAVALMPAMASAFPEKPVRIVVPSGAGGPTDMLARLVAERLGRVWKSGVIIENKPGAAQMIGTDYVAKASPDGYTLLLTSDGSITINPGLYPKMPYDPIKDLAPISKLATVPLVMVVHPSVAAKSVPEFVTLAKSTPGTINFGSGGSMSRIGAELFRSMTEIQLVHVPYKGSGPLVIGLLGNEVQMAFDGASSSLPQIKAGKLRALAISSKERLLTLPDVPTVAEAGVPGYESGAWLGLFAPAGTPKDVLAKINEDFGQVMRSPDLQKRIADLGMTSTATSQEAFASQIKTDTAKWTQLIKKTGMQAD